MAERDFFHPDIIPPEDQDLLGSGSKADEEAFSLRSDIDITPETQEVIRMIVRRYYKRPFREYPKRT